MILRSFIIAILAVTLASAQSQIGTWKNFTDMKSVRAMASAGSTVWVATGGGIFAVDTVQGSVRTFNNSDGLTSNDLRAVSVTSDGQVWVGAADGSVNVYHAASDSWSAIDDIRTSSRKNKAVNAFVSAGDTMFIAGEFGVSIFNRQRGEFGDTYFNFGFSGQPIVTSLSVDGSRVWVGTTQGIAMGLRSSRDLTAPSGWTLFTSLPGLPSSVTAIAAGTSGVVAGTAAGAALYTGTSFEPLASLAGRSVIALASTGEGIASLSTVGTNSQVDEFDLPTNPPVRTLALNGYTGSAFWISGPDGSAWIGTPSNGVARSSADGWSFISPNGPRSNQFISIGVEDDGTLWAASGLNGNGKGFYRYRPDLAEGSQWKNFTAAGNPLLLSDDYYKVSVAANGTVWISSWGKGVVQVAGDSVRRRIDAGSKPKLDGAVPQDPTFVVAGSVVADPEGRLWFAVRTAVNGNHLARMVDETTFVYYQNQYNPFEGMFQNMVIDRNGTKWFGNSEPSDKKDRGLYYFNEDRLVSGTLGTGGWGYLSSSDGLSSNAILSCAVDHGGDVWIGMDLGATIIVNPLSPRSGRLTVLPVREQSIQTIAVDAVDNKWIGTKEGVFVLSPDGTQLLAQYTVLSTGGQLVDNDVRSIAIDQRRGIVYCGTEKGLSSLRIAAVQTQPAFSTLDVSPNPFQVPSPNLLTIVGLVDNSSIKILSVSGSLVAQFRAQGGGRAFWDGRDDRGNLVASGVYYIVAYAENGSDVTTGTVAVVRR